MKQEATLQSSCFKYFRYKYHSLQMLYFAVPNGGFRNKIEARNLKLQGVVSGVADTFLSVARGNFHGLYIEFKSGKNSLTTNQIQFQNTVTAAGYRFEVVRSFDEFKQLIAEYLGY